MAWSVAIGPVAVWRVLTHGTTTVWDHLEYPGRELTPSPQPQPWPLTAKPLDPSPVFVEGEAVPFEEALETSDTLAFLVLEDGELAYEWYAPNHGPDESSMIFSVTKSVLSLLVGAAIDDGMIDSVDDSVALYVPELADQGFEEVDIEDLLRMDTSSEYVEGDNPFGIHVEFNYTDDLTEDILSLETRDAPADEFRYKSGDNAVLGLVLDRALGETTITGYLQQRLWDPLGFESSGIWSTDHEDGLERTWCCLALTAPDLARFGQLALTQGKWGDRQVISSDWFESALEPGYTPNRWPSSYRDSALANYGYQWWITDDGAWLALGKDGQYMYVDPATENVVVRLGQSRGELDWLAIIEDIVAGD